MWRHYWIVIAVLHGLLFVLNGLDDAVLAVGMWGALIMDEVAS